MSKLYFHSVPLSKIEHPHTSVSHETSVVKMGKVFCHRQMDRYTGRIHERYFDSLRDFVIWHYNSVGYEVLDASYPFETEVKVLRATDSDVPYQAAFLDLQEAFEWAVPVA